MSAQAGTTLDSTRRDTALSVEQLWLRHIELGGSATLGQLHDYLSSDASVPAPHHDLIAHALNERLWELDRNAVVRYADLPTPGVSELRAHLYGAPPIARVRAPTCSVVIPTLNEAKNLSAVLKALPDDIDEIVIVDGRSTDNTVAVARACRPDVKVVLQDGTGKGNALACGFRAVTSDITVMLDGDGSTDPGEIPRFVAALVAGADFAKGSRFTAGGGSADMTFFRRMGNRMFTGLVNLVWRVHYTDLCYGYAAFWTTQRRVVEADCNGFEVETLMNIRAAASELKVVEVPSFEELRLHGTSNLRVVRDGMRVLRTILAELLRPT